MRGVSPATGQDAYCVYYDDNATHCWVYPNGAHKGQVKALDGSCDLTSLNGAMASGDASDSDEDVPFAALRPLCTPVLGERSAVLRRMPFPGMSPEVRQRACE